MSSFETNPLPLGSTTTAEWTDWKWQQRNRLRTADAFDGVIALTADERLAIAATAAKFRMAVTPYYAALIDPNNPRCPIRAQSIPTTAELQTAPNELRDPLAEERHQPHEAVIHRYPDRALLYTTHNCPVYCRHCTRKRKVSDPSSASSERTLEEGIDYIRNRSTIRDVLLSGGDPLTLSDDRLDRLLTSLRAISHVEIVRLGTRNLVTLPFRVTTELAAVLRNHRPIYVHTHFNHPRECTEAAAAACDQLADAGCVLNNQMVLLRGVNDDPDTVRRLNHLLLRMRVQPYYMFQADVAEGISHFRTPIDTGLHILEQLRGWTSGMAVPHFVFDLPDGGGKVPLVPNYVVAREGERWRFRTYHGQEREYHE